MTFALTLTKRAETTGKPWQQARERQISTSIAPGEHGGHDLQAYKAPVLMNDGSAACSTFSGQRKQKCGAPIHSIYDHTHALRRNPLKKTLDREINEKVGA